MNAPPKCLAKPATSREEIAELHEFTEWPAKRLRPLVLAMLGLSLVATMLPPAYWPWLLLVCPALGVVMFIFAISFHDAAHDRLHPVHKLNELIGHLIGSLSFVPLEVYRHAHARHHAYLGTENDPELWPFNAPGKPRVLRVLWAFGEIFLGLVFTPLLFLRSVSKGTVTPEERRRIRRGYVLCLVNWAAIVAVVSVFGLWYALAVGLVIPMAISAMLQTLNKYIQHVGLHGRTVLGLTRTVVDEHPAGEVVSSAMFFNDYHGTHHRYAKIPYYNLPTATPYTLANASEFCPVYPHLASAFLAMLPCLADPKVGPQWLEREESTSTLKFTGKPKDWLEAAS